MRGSEVPFGGRATVSSRAAFSELRWDYWRPAFCCLARLTNGQLASASRWGRSAEDSPTSCLALLSARSGARHDQAVDYRGLCSFLSRRLTAIADEHHAKQKYDRHQPHPGCHRQALPVSDKVAEHWECEDTLVQDGHQEQAGRQSKRVTPR